METAAEAALSWPEIVAEANRSDSPSRMNWPNFFVVGAMKAGSTLFYTHLKRHPEVFLPEFKEIRFFQPEHQDRRHASPDRYRDLYARAGGYKAIGEVTPYYLPDAEVPARIHAVVPHAKIIIILRDPVERAYSHFLYYRAVRIGGTSEEPAPTFREALRNYDKISPAQRWQLSREYIEQSFYAEGVRRYFETFGRDQVLVLLFEDLAKNPNEVFARVARHIGVDPAFFAKMTIKNDNPYRMPRVAAIRWGQRLGLSRLLPRSLKQALWPVLFRLRKPQLDTQSLRQLQKLFEPDVTRLEELLGRKLPELRKTWMQ